MKIKNTICSVLAGFITFIVITGCDDVVSADLNVEFFIRPGQKVDVRESGLEITFSRVIEDSRCPKGVECVWAGNGKVELSIHFPGEKERVQELNTNLEPKDIMAGEYKIRLVELQPYPEKSQENLQEKYRLKLIVEK